jgi:PAS domain S-box-containing protein
VVALANDTALVTRDGREVPIEDSAAPILDAAGSVTGVVLVFHDVTVKRRAQAELREAHDRAVWLARFPDENPNPVLRVSADGTMLYCNPASAEIPGWECEVGKPVQGPLLPLFRQSMPEGKEVTQDIELGGRFYSVSITPFPEEGYANVYGRDITERKRAEEALHESRHRLSAIVDSIADGFYALDREWRITHINDTALRYFRRNREGMLGHTIFDVFPGFRGSIFETEYRRAMESGEPVRIEAPSIVTDGIVEIHAYPGQDNLTILFRDVTERIRMEETLRQRTLELQQMTETLEQQVKERTAELGTANEVLRNQIEECARIESALKKSESDLRHLSTELLSAQEKERKMIAGEIHDSIGSSLSAIKFKVESTMTEVAGSPKTTTALKNLIPIIQGAIEEARRIQMNLRPSMLDDLGILATISWFCRQFESTYSKIRISQSIEIEEHVVPASLRTVIFRVLQEGLNNIAKHSLAKMALLSLRKTDQAIELVIQDNGQGFDLSTVQAPEGATHGLGLESMRERTELSGGSFVIESTQGKGTMIRASWRI